MMNIGFYPHFFWVADPKDGYNCSGKSYEEWAATGTSSIILGTYFAVTGVIFLSVYGVVIWAMSDGRILRQSCYKLMYFNCFLDIGNLFCNSLVCGIMFYQGAVFCTHPTTTYLFGALGLGCWCSSCFNCIVIGINRCCIMFDRFTCLFNGKMLYFWFVSSIAVFLYVIFFTRTVIFNSTMGAFFYTPFIRDYEVEHSEFTNVIHPFINILTAISISALYIILCTHVALSRQSCVKNRPTNNSKSQKSLFIQCVAICLSTCLAAYVYVYMQYFTVPDWFVVAASIAYQICSALPCFVYWIFNSAVRRRAKKIVQFQIPSAVGVAFTF